MDPVTIGMLATAAYGAYQQSQQKKGAPAGGGGGFADASIKPQQESMFDSSGWVVNVGSGSAKGGARDQRSLIPNDISTIAPWLVAVVGLVVVAKVFKK